MKDKILSLIKSKTIYIFILIHFGLFTMIRVNNFGELKFVFGSQRIHSAVIMTGTFLLLWMFQVIYTKTCKMKYIAAFTVILAIGLLTGGEVAARFFAEKRSIWECIMYLFPLFLCILVDSLSESYTKGKGILAAALIVVWTAFVFLITGQLPISYKITIALTCMVLLGVVLWHFKQAASIAKASFFTLYAIGCLGYMLVLKVHSSLGVADFLYDGDLAAHRELVAVVFRNAKLFGSAVEISGDFLWNSQDVMHTIAVYYGIVPMCGYLACLVLFLVAVGKMLVGLGDDVSLYWMFWFAYISMGLRVILGTLHSLGVGCQVMLPFMGYVGAETDWIHMGVLLAARTVYYVENGKENLFLKLENKFIDYLVGRIVNEDDSEGLSEKESYAVRLSMLFLKRYLDKDDADSFDPNTLLIYGNEFDRDTLAEFMEQIIKENTSLSVINFDCKEFASGLMDELRSGRMDTTSYLERFMGDLVIIRNVDAIAGLEVTTWELFRLADLLLEQGKKCVYTSSVNPVKLKELFEERYYSRLTAGLISDMG